MCRAKLAELKLATAEAKCANLRRQLASMEEAYGLMCMAKREVEERLRKVLNPLTVLNLEGIGPFRVVVNGEIVDLSDSEDEEEATVEDVLGAEAGAEFVIVGGSTLATMPQQTAVDSTSETLPGGAEGEGMPQGEILGATADS
ncbi:hypothetical protein RJT34_13174 [Clitoria ternatea]|uniref:Uncharacterized protein n=1 Tax=Clitoria ternatea TaxID=43366 RepID=A0AAN9JNI7_CLITE